MPTRTEAPFPVALGALRLLHNGIPRAAGGALPRPFCGLIAALRAVKQRFLLSCSYPLSCHPSQIPRRDDRRQRFLIVRLLEPRGLLRCWTESRTPPALREQSDMVHQIDAVRDRPSASLGPVGVDRRVQRRLARSLGPALPPPSCRFQKACAPWVAGEDGRLFWWMLNSTAFGDAVDQCTPGCGGPRPSCSRMVSQSGVADR